MTKPHTTKRVKKRKAWAVICEYGGKTSAFENKDKAKKWACRLDMECGANHKVVPAEIILKIKK